MISIIPSNQLAINVFCAERDLFYILGKLKVVVTFNLSLCQPDILKTPFWFWFIFRHFHVSFQNCLAGLSYTIAKNIFKFFFENLSSKIADACRSLLETCFATVARNRSRTFARVPQDNCDITIIYSQWNQQKTGNRFPALHWYFQKSICCGFMTKFALKTSTFRCLF